MNTLIRINEGYRLCQFLRGDVKKKLIVLGGGYHKWDGGLEGSRAGPQFLVKNYHFLFFASIRSRSHQNV